MNLEPFSDEEKLDFIRTQGFLSHELDLGCPFRIGSIEYRAWETGVTSYFFEMYEKFQKGMHGFQYNRE